MVHSLYWTSKKMAQSFYKLEWLRKLANFFNCHGCRLFILCEIHCFLCPAFLRYNNSVLARVEAKLFIKSNLIWQTKSSNQNPWKKSSYICQNISSKIGAILKHPKAKLFIRSNLDFHISMTSRNIFANYGFTV